MSTMLTTVSPEDLQQQLLDELLRDSHPMMVEGFFLAALPYWYDVHLFAAMRRRADNRDEWIVGSLSQYSFVTALDEGDETNNAYLVHPLHRALLNERWIAQDAVAYREAHRRALVYWQAHPDPDPDAHARNLLYHQLFVDSPNAIEHLIGLFRGYIANRQLATGERMLESAREAQRYLLLLGDTLPAGFDDLLLHLEWRLGQQRGRWAESLEPLKQLSQKVDLQSRLRPYVVRAFGDALMHTDDYVAAIAEYEQALKLFDQQVKEKADLENARVEGAHTLVALGDGYVGLAHAALGREERDPVRTTRSGWRHAAGFLSALPLVIYLSHHLGLRVWRPGYWAVVTELDWIIARLFVTGAAFYRKADPILEEYGMAPEGVIADAKLADIYLALGDASYAGDRYMGLIDDRKTPMSEYGRATALLGLARAFQAQGQSAKAAENLETTLPLLRRFQGTSSEALAEMTLADVLRDLGRPDEAPTHYELALHVYEKQKDDIGATQVAERLDTLARDKTVASAPRAAAAQLSESITTRLYPVGYRHPAVRRFRRASVLALMLVLFLIPIVAIRLEIGTFMQPEITFHASPLLSNEGDFNPDLSQPLQTRLAPVPDPEVLWQAAVILLLAYLVLSALLGLLVITLTPLRTVQSATTADAVHLDAKSLHTGRGASHKEIAWTEVIELVRANVYAVSKMSRNESRAAIVGPEARVIVRGRTIWYESLWQRINLHSPSQARRIDVSFSALRSPMGALYLISMAGLALLSILSITEPELLFRNLAGTLYSLADLYPYFYLGLFLPPMWWFVVQPLRQYHRLDPHSVRLAMIAGGAGLALAVLRVSTRFRPWLTVPDIYPTLAIMILVGGAAIILISARRSGGSRLPPGARVLCAAIAVCILALMGAVLWRDVASYDSLVRGNSFRDKALKATAPDSQMLARAEDAYARAAAVADAQFVGIKGRDVLRGGPGLPATDQIVWVAATNSRAVMRMLQGEDRAAILADFDALLQESQLPAIYAWRALVGLGACKAGVTEADGACLANVREDLTRAIAQEPKNARYLLWRGYVQHATDNLQGAKQDYDDALEMSEDGALDWKDQAKALTGKGWIDFYAAMKKDKATSARRLGIEQAGAYFRQAIAKNPSLADAHLGLGYALYQLRKYDEAVVAWQKAADIRPNDIAPQLSLGALYWRMAGRIEGYVDEKGQDMPAKEYCNKDFTPDQRNKAEEYLQNAVDGWTRALELPGLDAAHRASTFSSLGQIYYLMRWCPHRDRVEMLRNAVKTDEEARKLEPTNPRWPELSGRLAYAVFLALQDRVIVEAAGYAFSAALPVREVPPNLEMASWALRAMQDLDLSITLSTDDSGKKSRIEEKVTRLSKMCEYVQIGLLEGQKALEANDVERALQWYTLIFELARRTNGLSLQESLQDIDGKLNLLEDWLATHPAKGGDAEQGSLETAISAMRAYYSGLQAYANFIELRDQDDAPDLEAAGWALQALQDFDHSITLSADERSRAIRTSMKDEAFIEIRKYVPNVLMAGQRALAADDVEQAARSYTLMFDLANRTGVVSLSLYGEVHALENWLAEHPEAEGEGLRRAIASAFTGMEARNAQTAAFVQGLSALKSGRVDEATAYYRQGVEEALSQGDLATISEAAIALRYEVENSNAPVVVVLHDALARVANIARSSERSRSVDAAVSTAVLAAAIDDYATAGWWLNEATRRTANDATQYYPAFLPVRDQLRRLWAATGVASGALVDAMEAQLDAQGKQYPGLAEDGLYWRYRAWLKYHLGLSAFRLGDELAARKLLELGVKDATQAYTISTDHKGVYTYLPEAAWGWYHVARGDDSYAQGQLDATLKDYEAAFDQFKPDKNNDAKKEKTQAAFKAAYTSLQLAQPDRARAWYQKAIDLAEQYKLSGELENEIIKLQKFLQGNAKLAATTEDILMQVQAAYERVNQK